MTWQPIKTAPKDGTKVLIYSEFDGVGVAGYLVQMEEREEFVRKAKDGNVYKTIVEDCGYWDSEVLNPTHWMPLPEPPK